MHLLCRLLSIGLFSGPILEALRTRRRVPSPAAPLRASSREGERATDWERVYMMRHAMRCPDCEYGDLLTVRRGTCVQEVRCSLCPTRFSLIRSDGYLNGHRLPSFPLEAERAPTTHPALH